MFCLQVHWNTDATFSGKSNLELYLIELLVDNLLLTRGMKVDVNNQRILEV